LSEVFNSANAYNKRLFGGRVQKIPLDAGFSCPNRDGTLSNDGCIYCCNKSFSPFYTGNGQSITAQLLAGIEFFGRRYNCQRFLAYFQSFSGTYAPPEILRARYEEALAVNGIEGLVIATRPDCLDATTVDLLSELARRVNLRVELGVESFDDRVLRVINRCHDSHAIFQAVELLRQAGIETCIHLIFGLPYEDERCVEESARLVSESGASLVKLHHLQVIAGTRLAAMLERGEIDVRLHSVDSFLEVAVRFITHLSPVLFVERFINRVPEPFLVAPRWGGITGSEFESRLQKKLVSQGLFQGSNSGILR